MKVLNFFFGVVESFCLFSEESFSKFVCFMMAEYIETKASEYSAAQTRISEIVTGRIYLIGIITYSESV